MKELEDLGVTVYIATDSGKVGFKGNVIELIKAENLKGDYFYSCGPKVMLRALAAYCEEAGVPVQVSLEERMGCGYGACVGCVCKTKAPTEKGFEHKKVCKDGPVFLGNAVKWMSTDLHIRIWSNIFIKYCAYSSFRYITKFTNKIGRAHV